LAALADLKKDEEVISGAMTTALAAYSYVTLIISSTFPNSACTHKAWCSCALVSLSVRPLGGYNSPGRDIPAWRVQPRNYLLFACHATNATAQSVQLGRFTNYWYNGGKEAKDKQKGPVTQAIEATKEEASKVAAAK
jgi:mitochondrial pyruvate carrier 1